MLRALWIWQRWIAAALPKLRADGFRQGLRAIHDEEPGHRRVEPTLDEIIDQRLDGRGVLRRALDERQRVLVTHAIDADGRHQHQTIADMKPVDLDREQVGAREIAGHELLELVRRERHEAPRSRRFR